MDVIVERCAALDVHKKTVMACVRAPDGGGGRRQELREYRTFSRDLGRLRAWLEAEGVSQVAMEATGVFWKPVWYVLEGAGFELLLANARHVKNVPGRKTDASDAAWLAQLLECGLLRGSFVPPREIARLRDLTRYRTKVVQERGRESQRLQKLLEDAGIKLDSVATDIQGVSCRRMIEALIVGERDPEVLAELALTRMRPKIGELREALVGRFDDHHALLARLHLDHMDELTRIEVRLEQQVDRLMAPFCEAATRLVTIPGIGKRVAEVVVAEAGIDMSRFPTAAHLASWAGLCPGNHESAGKRRSGKARKGNAALRSALCEAAWAAAHTKDGYLPAQYRRFLRRFGKNNEGKALFALAHTLLVIIWHVLANGCDYQDLGGDYFQRRNDADARQRYLVRELQKLGHIVTLQPAA
ncbi:MAG: IS110 family transposase [Actinomycetota bacterium]|nr:IS110 family transposase [Actinomycetota bacterium]